MVSIGTQKGCRTRTGHNGQTRHGKRYDISSGDLGAKAIAAAVRAHRGIENRLHRVLEVVGHDGLTRPRSGDGPRTVAVARHMATKLIRHPGDGHCLENRRELVCLGPNFLESLIQIQPTST